jgi:isoleucyl-tRNA synthetase
MFKEISGAIDYDRLELEILKLWEEKDIFKKPLEKSKDLPPFVFFEGPPTANGKPGIHHVVSRTIKDLVCRYKTMTGHYVSRKAGWDTHGLPVEIEVERQLNISRKEEILEYGVKKFNDKCRASVFSYKEDWDELTKRIGYWLDLEHPYITFENNYIETLWWILDQFWKKELIYKGFKILPYCPRCETPLSSHEVSQGYKDTKDPSVYVKMRLKDDPDINFLVWTTTPWTLISNVALAVGEEIDYVQVLHKDEKLILAKSRLEALDGDYEITAEMKGKELIGKRYEPLFTYVDTRDKDCWYVVAGDFVSTEDGSGIVHIAPAFGEDDYQVGRKYDLPVLRPVDKTGAFTDEVEPWKGKFVKEADPEIIYHLRQAGRLYKKQTIEHSYPHCWRCDTPLLYYARESWYIRTTAFKQQLMNNADKINWHPKEVGSGRFGEWLKNNIDWAISRDRFWGTPLNIWVCDECGHKRSIGSIDELKKLSLKPIETEEVDLHKHFVDGITIKCEKCGSEMRRTPEVVDVWFDSGAMPYAQWHYPFENRETFERSFPADFICEGIDQTRGWFYSLLAISTMLFDQPAYKNVVVNELVLDKEGRKMSKRFGNTVVPQEVIKKYGVDAIRWYMVYLSPPWVTKRFDEDGVKEAQRKFFGTLTNVYSFFALYANIDKFDPRQEEIPFEKKPEIDRWILSRLYTVAGSVHDHMEKYEINKAARMINDFVIDEVSNWYVRRNRRRFWKSEMGEDKLAAYQTLYTVLFTTAKLIAPFTPFLAEELFQNLKTDEAPESVHMETFPLPNEEEKRYINPELESRMAITQKIVYMARALRNDVQIKVRQPLSKIMVHTPGEEENAGIREMHDIICEEINVKDIELVDDIQKLANLAAKPNFKSLGKKAGKLMKDLNNIIRSFGSDEILKVKEEGSITVNVNGASFELAPEDLEIVSTPKEGLEVATEGQLSVALDTEISETLRHEGIAREMVNRIQNFRKEAGLEVTDRIHLMLELPEELAEAVKELEGYIREETLAENIEYGGRHYGNKKEISIDPYIFYLSMEKARG